MWEYVKRDWERDRTDGPRAPPKARRAAPAEGAARAARGAALPPIDRTYKLFIGGAQVRPDQGYSRPVHSPTGTLLGEIALGNRKDIRNAVEAAQAAAAWALTSRNARGPRPIYIAANRSLRPAW